MSLQCLAMESRLWRFFSCLLSALSTGLINKMEKVSRLINFIIYLQLSPCEFVMFFHRRSSCSYLKDLYYNLKDNTPKRTSCHGCNEISDAKNIFECDCKSRLLLSWCAKRDWVSHKSNCETYKMKWLEGNAIVLWLQKYCEIKYFHQRSSCKYIKNFYYNLKEHTPKNTWCHYCDGITNTKNIFECECKMAIYCCRECAKSDWESHKSECKTLVW